jgi:transcriptional regulator with XRE-family HTH domain
MNIGERLKELRINKNLSQLEIAENIGVTRSAYCHYEMNNRNPDYETLSKLASLFDVTIDYIIGRDINILHQLPNDAGKIKDMLNQLDDAERKSTIDLLKSAMQKE